MKIEGQQGHLYPNQLRLDSSHPAKDSEKANAAQKNDQSTAASHLSEFITQLHDKFRKVAEIRSQEVDRVSDNLRAGHYATPESTQQTAAAILAAAKKLS